jgi:hypothetical protein
MGGPLAAHRIAPIRLSQRSRRRRRPPQPRQHGPASATEDARGAFAEDGTIRRFRSSSPAIDGSNRSSGSCSCWDAGPRPNAEPSRGSIGLPRERHLRHLDRNDHRLGATHGFGIVGDGINSVIEALRKRQDRIAFVSVRHEEAAAFMACALAKYTGRLESAWVLPDPALCTC